MKKPFPAVFIALTGAVFLGSLSPAVAQPKSPPQVTAVSPVSNVALAKGGSILLTLVGSNFIYVSSADMVRADAPAKVATGSPLRPTPGVKVTFTGVRTATTLGIFLEAPLSATDGLYILRLWAGGEPFAVPQEIFRVNVSWGRPQIVDCVPRQAPIGTVVTVRGKYFGDPAHPEGTQVLGYVRQPG